MIFFLLKNLLTCIWFMTVTLLVGITTKTATAVMLPLAPVIESTNGLLEATLTVDIVTSLDGTRIAPGFNGGPVGPTLRANAGDRVRITLVNNLEESSAMDKFNYDFVLDPEAEEILQTIIYNRLAPDGNVDVLPREGYWGKNFINLHFHGLMVDPHIEMNRNIAIDGGGNSYTYEFVIPENHQGGLTWYHNHFHGTASYSSLSGLYGAFVVTPKEDPYAAMKNDPSAVEVIMILSESLTYDDHEPQNLIPLVMNFEWEAVTNGMYNPTFTFQQGQTAYFRVINAGERPPACLSIDNHMLINIAADATFPTPETGIAKEKICVATGARAEFYVTLDTPGTFTMHRDAFNLGIQGPVCEILFGIANTTNCISYDKETVVATILVEQVENASPAEPVQVTPLISSYLQNLLKQPVVGSREVSMDISQTNPIFQLPFMSGPPAQGVGLNNRLANAVHISGNITGGTCENWTVYSNPPGLIAHPFHIHSVPILITSVDGVEVEEPFWRDTFPVSVNMTGTVCFPPQKEDAFLSVHCHMPHHQDGGMAGYYMLLATPSTTSSASVSGIRSAVLSLFVTSMVWLYYLG